MLRQPTVDIASDDSSSDDDQTGFSASFEAILETHRTKKLAAMNQAPSITISSPSTSAAASAAAAAASPRHDADTSHFNNMFNNCDLNAPGPRDVDATFGLSDNQTHLFDVPEPSMFEHLSPCKRVGLMRPSTVLEDSCETDNGSARSSVASGMDRSTADAERSAEKVAIATGGRLLPAQTSFETALSFNQPDGDKRAASTSSSSSSANYTRDSLFASDRPSMASTEPSRRSPSPAAAAFDDTLEVVEYDHTATKYVLKPVRRVEVPAACAESDAADANDADNADDDDDNVIVLDSDSSPEVSFHTAHDELSVKKERQSERMASTHAVQSPQPVQSAKHVIDLDSSSSESESESAAMSEVEPATNAIADPHIRHSVQPRSTCSSSVAANSLLDDSLALDMPDEFNDTIERMDHLMELGRRIQQKQQLLKAQPHKMPTSPLPSVSARNSPRQAHADQPSAISSSRTSPAPARTPSQHPAPSHSPRMPVGYVAQPAARNSPRVIAGGTAAAIGSGHKNFRTPVARNSPILKAKTPINMAAPTSTAGVFKKPTTITPSAQLKKTPSAALSGVSRIPKPRSAGKSNFDYVRSPIGAYISKRAPNPMQQKVTIERDFLDSTYCAGASKELDFTLPAQPQDENRAPAAGSCLPKKAYVQADRQQVRIDR